MGQSKYISLILSLCLSFSVYASALPKGGRTSDAPNIYNWLKTLRRADTEIRLKNAYNISSMVPFSKRSVLILIKALKDKNLNIRMYSASALGEATTDFNIIVPALIKSLSDPAQEVREHTTLALAKIGEPAVPALVKALERMNEGFPSSGSFRTRRKSSPKSMRVAVPLLEIRGNKQRRTDFHLMPWDARVSDYAAIALMQIGGAASTEVARALKSHIPYVRKYAEYILASIGEPAASPLIRYVNDPNREVRSTVRSLLSDISISEKNLIPELRQLLKSNDKELRIIATSGLSGIGMPALPELDVSLRDVDADVRVAAVEALQEISEDYGTPDLLQRLFTALNDGSDDVKIKSLEALIDIKAKAQDVMPLLALLKSRNVRVRVLAAQALGKTAGHDPASVPALITALSDTDFYVRANAAQSLGVIGGKARSAIPHLILAFKSPDPKTRFYSKGRILEALGNIGESSPEVINLLSESLQDFVVREDALKAFKALGETAAKDSVPVLLHAIQAEIANSSEKRLEDSTSIRRFIVTLPDVGESGVSALLDLLATTKSEFVRNFGIFALGICKSQDDRIVPTLIDFLSDDSLRVRRSAGRALNRRPSLPEQIVPALIQAIKDPDTQVRIEVLESLKKIGKGALPAVPSIIEQLSDTDPRIRSNAAETLSAVDSTNETGITMLIEELDIPHGDDGFDDHYNFAVLDLQEIGQPAVPALARALKDPNENVRRNASLILKDIGLQAKGALPALVEALKDSDSKVRLYAAQAIGEMKSDARSEEVGHALIDLLTDNNYEVRLAAADALLSIGFELNSSIQIFSTIVNDDFIRRLISDALYELTEAIRPHRPRRLGKAGRHRLPPFPWPPPRFSDWSVLSSHLLGSNISSLGDVHEKLGKVLSGLGYDGQGLFEVPGDGFALVTRVERINNDGTSVLGPHRWTRERISPTSMRDYVSKLFLEKPGRFRLFVFAITTLGDFRHSDKSLSEAEAWNLVNEGGRVLPPDLKQTLFKGYFVHTLIYVFKKKAGEVAIVEFEEPLGPETHLKRSGILNKL